MQGFQEYLDIIYVHEFAKKLTDSSDKMFPRLVH